MHTLIKRIFDKKGLDEKDLSDDDKQEYEKWERILSAKPVTLESLKEYFDSQKSIIEDLLGNLDNTTQKNDRLIAQHSVYKTMAKALTASDEERKQLEQYLQSMLQ